METVAIAFLLTSGLFVLGSIGYVVRGWVLATMWTWFMVPLGAPTLRIPFAIGVAIIVGYLTHQSIREPEDDRSAAQRIADTSGKLLLGPLLVLGVAWIVKQFI